MLNDPLGDCTIAGFGHAIQVWTANTGPRSPSPTPPSKTTTRNGTVTSPATHPLTEGGIELDVLNDWQKQGFGTFPHSLRRSQVLHLTRSASPSPSSAASISDSPAHHRADPGCLGRGSQRRRQGQARQLGRSLRLRSQIRSERLHLHHLGQLKTMTLAFWKKYCDEAHTLLTQDWISANGSPSGFNQAQLQADLKAIA